MKYLQDDRLSALTARFFFGGDDEANFREDDAVLLGNSRGGGGGDTGYASYGGRPFRRHRRVWGRLEAYTMKRAGTDKKYAADLGSRYVTLQQQLEDRLARGTTTMMGSSSSSPPEEEEVVGGPWGMVLPPPPLPPHPSRHSSAPAPRPRDSDVTTATSAVATSSATSTTTTVKRRSQSVGFQDDCGGVGAPSGAGGTSRKKQARSRSNSLDESSLMVYRTNLGDFAAQETRRLMTDLILTLNMSFPDYDFECVSPNDFEKCPLSDVVQNVDSLLGELAADHHQQQQDAAITTDDAEAAMEMAVPPTLPAGPPQPPSPQPGVVGDEDGNGLVGGDGHGNEDDNDAGRGGGMYPKDHLLSELWSALDHVVHLSDCEVYLWKNHPENLLQGSEGEDEPVLWGFHYLFVNKPLKRIVFFGCCETLRNRPDPSSAGDDAMDDEDDDVAGGQYSYAVDRNSLDRDENGATGDVELVSDEDDDEEEEEDESSRLRYTRILSSGGGDGSDVDFDLDPSAMAAGGIPISTV